MRTAEQILKETDEDNIMEYNSSMVYIQHAERAINAARKELLEECAERAKSEWIRWGTNMGHAVDKQSILNLLKELK